MKNKLANVNICIYTVVDRLFDFILLYELCKFNVNMEIK